MMSIAQTAASVLTDMSMGTFIVSGIGRVIENVCIDGRCRELCLFGRETNPR